jgi:hypothetical protein
VNEWRLLWRTIIEAAKETPSLYFQPILYLFGMRPFKPNYRVRALKELKFEKITYPAQTEFNIEIRWSLGGLITAYLETGEQVDLKTEALLDPDIEPVQSLKEH